MCADVNVRTSLCGLDGVLFEEVEEEEAVCRARAVTNTGMSSLMSVSKTWFSHSVTLPHRPDMHLGGTFVVHTDARRGP